MKKITLLFALLFIAIAAPSCFYDLPASGQDLQWQRVGVQDDTVSVFTSFTFAFSRPIVDSGVSVVFDPPFYDYSRALNGAGDTFRIRVEGRFEPGTRYVLRRTQTLHGAHSERLFPEDDSLVFFTHAAESEFNDTRSSADSLGRFMDGLIATTGDTDMFVLAQVPLQLTIASLDARIGVLVIDSMGTLFSPAPGADAGISLDTIMLPDSLRPPLYCAVYSQYGVAGSRYVLGALAP